jgi:hypothetical protein
MLLPACHYHLWEMRINFGSLWHQGHLHTGNMDATFAQFGLNEKILRINGPTHCSSLISLMSAHHCASILKVRLGACWNCILTQSVNFSLSNYDSTSQYSVLFHSIMPSHHQWRSQGFQNGGLRGRIWEGCTPSAGGPGAVPPEKFPNYRCTQVSFSAFFRQKSVHSRLYLCL